MPEVTQLTGLVVIDVRDFLVHFGMVVIPSGLAAAATDQQRDEHDLQSQRVQTWVRLFFLIADTFIIAQFSLHSDMQPTS